MTAYAVTPKRIAVNIFFGVTFGASFRQRNFIVRPNGFLVAGQAVEPDMGAFQFENIGLAIMIKLPQAPAIGCMAGFTVFTEALLVFVVGTMAAVAFCGCRAESRILMATFAGHQAVQAQQGKTAEVVVEACFIAPAFGGVTALAAFILRVAMNVVEAMAVDAACAEFFCAGRPGVAGATGEILVFVPQGKGGFLVIKNSGLPRLAGVAAFAFFPIKPGMPIGFLMAGETISL